MSKTLQQPHGEERNLVLLAAQHAPQGAESPSELQKSPGSAEHAAALPGVSFNKQELMKSLSSL